MVQNQKRRQFLGNTALALSALQFNKLLGSSWSPFSQSGLVADPNGILSLQNGFSYKILSRRHDMMSDGYRTPGRPDGMGCFENTEGDWVLMRNHENDFGDLEDSPYLIGQQPPDECYNKGAWGGVSRMVLSNKLEVKSSNMVLMGTSRNCAGGVSPWGWFTCEETVVGDHGFVFLCNPNASRVEPFQMLPQFGKFMHEAAVVDPVTLATYLTEDRDNSCLYRFLPEKTSDPFAGKLQALVLNKGNVKETTNLPMGTSYEASWTDLDDTQRLDDSLRQRAAAKGAAVFRRAEGMWFSQGSVYFTCTSGGQKGIGQVMRLTLPPGGKERFSVFAECTDKNTAEKVDSITVSPSGNVFVGEDGDSENHIRIVKPNGTFVDFASTPSDEICGVCFSPDGSTLFFNLQKLGLTLAVTGPFEDFSAVR